MGWQEAMSQAWRYLRSRDRYGLGPMEALQRSIPSQGPLFVPLRSKMDLLTTKYGFMDRLPLVMTELCISVRPKGCRFIDLIWTNTTSSPHSFGLSMWVSKKISVEMRLRLSMQH